MGTPNMALQPGQFQPSEEEMQALMQQYGFDPRRGFVPSGSGRAPLEQYNANFDPTTNRQNPTGDVGSNPYPQFRYGSSGPGMNVYGTPSEVAYGGVAPYYGGDITAMAAGNRDLAQAGGLSLGRDLYNYTAFQQGQAGNFQDQLNSAYYPIAQGQGGYTDQQKAAILNNPYLQGLQITPEQQQSNYLSQEEQQNIYGDPYKAFQYSQGQGQANQDLYGNYSGQIGADLGSQEASINGALQGGARDIRNAVYDDQSKSYQDLSDIASLTRGQVGNTASNVRGSLGYSQGLVGGQLDQTREQLGSSLTSQAGAVRSYIDPRALTTSPEYQATYNVSPQDQQNILNKAGRQVGSQELADEDRLLQEANAAGNTNPLALAAERNRMRVTGASNQANAMSDAAIQAKQLQLQTEQQRENTRLGAEQSYAGLGSSAEMGLGNQQVGAAQQYGSLGTNAALGLGNQAVSAEYGLGQQGLQNEQYMGSNTLSQQNTLAAAQLGAEQYLNSQNLASQQYLGNSRLNNTQQLMNTGIGVNQFNSQQGLGALQTGEQNASNRAGAVATNRQGVNQSNQGQEFQRGQYIYGQGNQANTNFANNQQAQEAEYRGYLTGAQSQANQNVSVGNQQRLGQYGATNQGVQGATSGAIENYKVPGQWKDIAGTTARFMGLKEGGVMKGPMPALVGEAGPELVIDLQPAADGVEVESDDGTPYGSLPQAQATHRKANPLYQSVLKTLSPTYSRITQNMDQEGQDQSAKQDSSGKSGGVLGLAMKAFGMAKGGTVGAHHFYGNRKKLKGSTSPTPRVKLVTKPTITTLGVKGPQAVVPLTPRPSNKLNPVDIPNLLKKYARRP